MKEFNIQEVENTIATIRIRCYNDVQVHRDEILNLVDKLETAFQIIKTHDLCHDLHGKVGICEFAEGCAREQRKNFGSAPHADALQEIKKRITRVDVSELSISELKQIIDEHKCLNN